MSNRDRPRIHFVSLGCSKNRVDTEIMVGVAAQVGHALEPEAAEADVIVVNTCGFIGPAKEESIDTILEMAEFKTAGRCKTLVVAGCLSQRYADQLAGEMPEVDHFLGSSDMLRLDDVLKGEASRMLVGNPAAYTLRASDPRVLSQGAHSAYLKIAEGCNRRCSFCAIPAIRGKQRSRPIADVVEEARRLVDGGVVELNLVSQDTVAFGRDRDGGETLAQLVRALGALGGLRWLRLHYLYPETLDDELIELLGSHPVVVPYVDMPLQHASDAMLRRMRRGHGGARLRRVVERLRERVKGLVFRTAFIVGHPGEGDADFDELCEFVRWAQFDHVGVFRYSDEEGVASHGQEAKVPAKVSAARHKKLMAVQRPIARARNRTRVGSTVDVLVEGTSGEHEFVMQGRHAGQAPEVDGNVYLSGGDFVTGTIVPVRVVQAADYDLAAESLDAPAELDAERPRPRRKVALRTVG